MLKKINKTLNKIDKLVKEMEEIKNGAIVNPKTNQILKDKKGNTVYYKDKC